MGGCNLDLAQEPVGPDGGSQFGTQHLERDLAVVLQVLGEVDEGHATGADFPLDRVPVPQGCSEQLERVNPSRNESWNARDNDFSIFA